MVDLSVNHKRKLESREVCLSYDDNRACKHAKLEPEILAPHNFGTCLHKWLSKVLVEQDTFNLERSGTPMQFMYLDKGRWEDYRTDVVAAISSCFMACKSFTKFSVDGRMYVVDFVHMVQLNLQTGSVRSVAWIDDRGQCFFPSRCIEDSSKVLSFLQWTSEHRTQPSAGCSSCRTSLETKNVSTSSGSSLHDFTQLGSRLTTLADDSQGFAFVKNKFLSGLGSLADHAFVTGIYRCTFDGTSGQLRLQTFKSQERAVEETRGDANVRYAWHGTSKKGVSGIILHGFGQPRVPKHRAVYGVGVYLAPEEQSHVSAIYSDVDENGAQHMLLCRVIMGRMEHVHRGSEQFHPSSELYDTGVDDLRSPRRHIIWSTHMNTHILPEFIVSFRLTHSFHAALITQQKMGFVGIVERPCLSRREGLVNKGTSVVGSRKAPQSPWISFPDLFAMMEQKLNPCALATLRQLYIEFQVGKLPRILLVKLMRVVAGDIILRKCIEQCMPYVGAEAQSEGRDHLFPFEHEGT